MYRSAAARDAEQLLHVSPVVQNKLLLLEHGACKGKNNNAQKAVEEPAQLQLFCDVTARCFPDAMHSLLCSPAPSSCCTLG
jgi:hypothetical protein